MRLVASRRPAWLWIVALVIATSLLYIVLSRVDWGRVALELGEISPGWLVVAAGFNLAIIALWAAQWHVFLPRGARVRYRAVFKIVALMTMVLNSVPYMVGHASGVLLLARHGRVGHSGALSVLALDQLAEGFGKLSILLLVALFIPLPPWLQQGIVGLVAGVAVLLIVLLWFAHRYRAPTQPHNDQTQSPWQPVGTFVSRWAHHLEALRDARVFGLGLLLALAMKASEATAILCVQQSFGLDLPAWSALLILASVGLATMVAIAPGNIGVYEATVFFVYQYLGASPEQALTLALIQHVCYLVPLVGTGYLMLLVHNIRHPDSDHSFTGTRFAGET